MYIILPSFNPHQSQDKKSWLHVKGWEELGGMAGIGEGGTREGPNRRPALVSQCLIEKGSKGKCRRAEPDTSACRRCEFCPGTVGVVARSEDGQCEFKNEEGAILEQSKRALTRWSVCCGYESPLLLCFLLRPWRLTRILITVFFQTS